MFLGRMAVLAVSVIAMVLAWPNNESILKIVSFAWAGFGASFGPIILLSLYWRKITTKGALWGMIAGAITVMIWGNVDVLRIHFMKSYLVLSSVGLLQLLLVISHINQMLKLIKNSDETLKILNEEK